MESFVYMCSILLFAIVCVCYLQVSVFAIRNCLCLLFAIVCVCYSQLSVFAIRNCLCLLFAIVCVCYLHLSALMDKIFAFVFAFTIVCTGG